MSLIHHCELFEQAEFWDKVTSQGNNPASTSTISWVNAETAARPAGVCTEYCKLADKSRFMWSVIPQQWSCRSQLQFADISFFLWTVFWSVDRLIALRLGMETRISCFAREDENEHLMTNGRLFFLQQAEYCLSIRRRRRRRFWTWFFLSLVSPRASSSPLPHKLVLNYFMSHSFYFSINSLFGSIAVRNQCWIVR